MYSHTNTELNTRIETLTRKENMRPRFILKREISTFQRSKLAYFGPTNVTFHAELYSIHCSIAASTGSVLYQRFHSIHRLQSPILSGQGMHEFNLAIWYGITICTCVYASKGSAHNKLSNPKSMLSSQSCL